MRNVFYLDDLEHTTIATIDEPMSFKVGDTFDVTVRQYRKLDHLKAEQRERLLADRQELIDKLTLKTVEIISVHRFIENNGDVDKLCIEYFCKIIESRIESDLS